MALPKKIEFQKLKTAYVNDRIKDVRSDLDRILEKPTGYCSYAEKPSTKPSSKSKDFKMLRSRIKPIYEKGTEDKLSIRMTPKNCGYQPSFAAVG